MKNKVVLLMLITLSLYAETFSISTTEELRAALSSSAENDIIYLAPGTYKTTDDSGGSFIVRNITMVGATTGETILDGSNTDTVITGSDARLENLTITHGNNIDSNNRASGIDSVTFTIVNCKIINNHNGDGSWGSALHGNDHVVINTLFYNNTGTYYGQYYGTNMTVINSVFIDGDSTAIYPGSSSEFEVIKNNVFINNTLYDRYDRIEDTANTTYSSTELESLFIDFSNGDYQLKLDSALINAGTLDTNGTTLPMTDMIGNARVNDATIDIGPYEYHNESGTLISAQADYEYLDATFGENGVAAVSVIDADDWLYVFDIKTHANGKIAALGKYYDSSTSAEAITITRLESNGSADMTFGSQNGSVVMPPFEAYAYFEVKDLFIQEDEKIVTMFSAVNMDYNVTSIVLHRFNIDGTLDDAFGNYGAVTTDLNVSYGHAKMVLQPDGKFLVSGYFQNNDTGSIFEMIRYNSDGTIDTTFGTDGFFKLEDPSIQHAEGLQLMQDGSALAMLDYYDMTTGTYTTRLVKVTAAGVQDTSFDGAVTLLNGAYTMNFVVDSRGKIIVIGSIPQETDTYKYTTFFMRLNSNGTLDTAYGNNGTVEYDFIYGEPYYQNIAVQNDNKIILSDSVYGDTSTLDLSVYRFNTDGTLDMAFGRGDDVGGVMHFPTGTFHMYPSDMTIQADGKILLGGEMEYQGSIGLIRLVPTKGLSPAIINYLLD